MKYLLLAFECLLLIAMVLVIFGVVTNRYVIGFVYLLTGIVTFIISRWKRKQIKSEQTNE